MCIYYKYGCLRLTIFHSAFIRVSLVSASWRGHFITNILFKLPICFLRGHSSGACFLTSDSSCGALRRSCRCSNWSSGALSPARARYLTVSKMFTSVYGKADQNWGGQVVFVSFVINVCQAILSYIRHFHPNRKSWGVRLTQASCGIRLVVNENPTEDYNSDMTEWSLCWQRSYLPL